jgi:16S rRNA processing protein RimM
MMLLLGHLAKVQGLRGEFLFHSLMDEPERLPSLDGLVLAPPSMNLDASLEPGLPARNTKVSLFRWQQDRPCVAFEGIPDRTAAEPFKGWALWMPEALATKAEGESFRHEWVGCDVFIGDRKIGEVAYLSPTPMGYDMVAIRDLRPGRAGLREVPYIKAWWNVDLANKRLDLDGPPGILDLQ